MRKIKNAMNSAATKAYLFGIRSKQRAAAALRGNHGEGFVDTALFSVLPVHD